MLKDYFWSLALVAAVLAGYSAIVLLKKSNDLHADHQEPRLEAVRSSAFLKTKVETQTKSESSSSSPTDPAPVND